MSAGHWFVILLLLAGTQALSPEEVIAWIVKSGLAPGISLDCIKAYIFALV